MVEDLRIALMGTSGIGRAHIERIHAHIRGAQVVACMDANAEFARQVAEHYGLRWTEAAKGLAQSPDIDAFMVTAADGYHEKYVLEGIRAGKPVFCEKPLAVEPEACKRIVEAELNAKKRLVQVGYMRRYDAGYRQMKAVLEHKKLGEPLLAYCIHRNYFAPDYYKTPMTVENTMAHEIDAMRWLLGEDYAQVEVVLPKKTRLAKADFHDPQIMILTTTSGIRVEVEAFLNSNYGYDIRCEICCEKGALHLPEPPYAVVRMDASRTTPICKGWDERFEDAYIQELEDWVRAARDGGAAGASCWDGYVASLTAAAASLARDTGVKQSITLPRMPSLYVE